MGVGRAGGGGLVSDQCSSIACSLVPLVSVLLTLGPVSVALPSRVLVHGTGPSLRLPVAGGDGVVGDGELLDVVDIVDSSLLPKVTVEGGISHGDA